MSGGTDSLAAQVNPRSRAAFLVGTGIFFSRISGFIRDIVFAFFFGNTGLADVWRVALKTPNVIQNLLGEGTLSASVIPVYSELLEEERAEDAGRFAGAALGFSWSRPAGPHSRVFCWHPF